MSIISEKINSKINSIKSDYLINKNIIHQGVKGGFNEVGLSSLIKEVIPQRYKISKGVVENNNGEQSNESDILIYDDDILPPYIKNDLAFVPVEAVKYVFEVKSTLDSTELKTTISKFERYKEIGGRSPTVLFSFSSDIIGSELSRYKKNEDDFFINPAISVFVVSGKSYFYKVTEEHYIKKYLPISEFLEKFAESTKLDINKGLDILSEMMTNDEFLNGLSRSQFSLLIKSSIFADKVTKNLDAKNLTVNGVDYSDIKFKIHKWIGVESSCNNVDLSFFRVFQIHYHKVTLEIIY